MLENRTIKSKLFISNIIITLVLISINVLLYNNTRNTIVKNINKDLSEMNNNTALFIDSLVKNNLKKHLEEKAFYINNYIKLQKKKGINPNEIYRNIDEIYLSFEEIEIYDGNKLIFSNCDNVTPKNLQKLGHKTFIIDNQNLITYSFYSPELERIIVLESYKNNFMEHVDLQIIKDYLNISKFNTNGYTYIMDRTGYFVHHPAYEGKNIKNYLNPSDMDGIDKILKGYENNYTTYSWLNPWDKNPKKKMAIYSYIDELDWVIVSTGYFDDFYAPLLPIKLNIVYIIVFLVLANFVFFFYLHTVFDRPIINIINKLRGINPKEGYDYIEIESSDEIGMIAATFNNLLSEIENYEINLENMVDRKTKELRIANEYLYHMTIYDKLTEVHNRSYIMEILSKKFIGKTKFSCILFDIDHFKKVNDTYGHLAGDFVLKELCSLISAIKDSSVELARYGGEEFIMCWDSDSVETFKEIEKIRFAIEHYDFVYNGVTTINITCSFGIASTYDFAPASIEELIDYSDAALYQSKNTGRNKTTIFQAQSPINKI